MASTYTCFREEVERGMLEVDASPPARRGGAGTAA
jgi:hypothetical protein